MQFQHPSRTPERNQSSSPTTSYTSHLHVRENELKIWEVLLNEVVDTATHLMRDNPLEIVEIGGASLQGLSLLRARPELESAHYTIIDEVTPVNTSRLTQLNGTFLHGSCAGVRADQLPPKVDFVIAMRALEYDSFYGSTLQRLNNLSSQPSYGIFVHNAENSPIFPRIAAHRLALTARIIALETFQRALKGEITIPDGLILVRQSWQSLSPRLQEREQFHFENTCRKVAEAIATGSEEEVINYLATRCTTFTNERQKLDAGYSERINSRRFWHESESAKARDDYLPYGPLLLQRIDLRIGTPQSGLVVHIDTVDLHNAWRMTPWAFESGVVPDVHFDSRHVR